MSGGTSTRGCYIVLIGESYKEQAEASGVSVRVVEGRLYRARAELRRKLAHLADA